MRRSSLNVGSAQSMQCLSTDPPACGVALSPRGEANSISISPGLGGCQRFKDNKGQVCKPQNRRNYPIVSGSTCLKPVKLSFLRWSAWRQSSVFGNSCSHSVFDIELLLVENAHHLKRTKRHCSWVSIHNTRLFPRSFQPNPSNFIAQYGGLLWNEQHPESLFC